MEYNNHQEVFIETSIMTDYLIKDNATREKVDNILNDFNRKITSNYVRMEFKKGPLQYLVYLHHKLVSCRNMTEVHQAISKLSCGPQRHRLSSVLEQIAIFYAKFYRSKHSEIIKQAGDLSQDEYVRQMAISHFSNSIRQSWRKFDKVVDEVINPMECFVDIQAPHKEGISKIYRNYPTTCKNSTSKCKIREFFNDNSCTFNDILERLQGISSPDQETTKRIKSLKQILRVKKVDIRPKDCWNCSDAIIAVEAPNNASIFNNNKKHYDPMCDAIGKRSIGYN